MSLEIDQKLEKFLEDIVAIEKKYAHERRGAKSNRRDEIMSIIEKFFVSELEEPMS